MIVFIVCVEVAKDSCPCEMEKNKLCVGYLFLRLSLNNFFAFWLLTTFFPVFASMALRVLPASVGDSSGKNKPV
jgi:hypothetical protein